MNSLDQASATYEGNRSASHARNKYFSWIMHFNISESTALRGEMGHKMQRFY